MDVAIQEFQKTRRQRQAVQILGSPARNIMLYGGSRSGKTFIAIFSIIVRASKVLSKHLIVRQAFNHAKRSIWLDTLPKVLRIAFPDLPIKWNNTDFYIILPNGSQVWVGGLDDDKNVEKILGNEYSTVYFNECSQIPFTSIQIAKTRLAEKNSLTKKTYYDCNPPTKSHWSYWLFEKKLNPADDEPLPDPNNYASIIMNPKDNLENIDAEYLALLSGLPEKERNRFLDGIYADESDGQVYYAFSREKHVKPQTRAPGTIFATMDFNVNPMTATILQFEGKRIRCLDEVYLENSDTYKIAKALKDKGYLGARIIPDSTGANRKTSGKSDFAILREEGFVIESTRNPFVADRVNNMNRKFSRDEIEIDPKCKKLVNDLEKVTWKDNKPDQSGANKMLTHCSDNLGYGAWWVDPIGAQVSKVEIQSPKER